MLSFFRGCKWVNYQYNFRLFYPYCINWVQIKSFKLGHILIMLSWIHRPIEMPCIDTWSSVSYCFLERNEICFYSRVNKQPMFPKQGLLALLRLLSWCSLSFEALKCHLYSITDSIKINRPGHNIRMYWPNFWQPTNDVQQNIFEKSLIEVCSTHLYASFDTFCVQIGQ